MVLPRLTPIPRRRDAPGQRPPSESFTTFGFLRCLLPLGALELLGFAPARAARRAAKSSTSILELVVVGFASLVDRHAVPLRFARNASMSCGVNRMERRSLPPPTSMYASSPSSTSLRSVRSLTPSRAAVRREGEQTLRVRLALARSPSRTQADVPARLGVEGRHVPAAPPLEVGRDDPLAAAAQLGDVRLDLPHFEITPSRNAIAAEPRCLRRRRFENCGSRFSLTTMRTEVFKPARQG